MSLNSNIEWTEATWNPTTGCDKVSSGCKYCYAERLALRLKAMGQLNYSNGFKLTLQRHMLDVPMKWKKPRVIFVNSMSDLFHDSVPLSFIQEVFAVIHKANWHRFQILTKRSDRLLEINSYLRWTQNIWMGVSVENDSCTYRIEHLVRSKAKLKFLSIEPMLGPIETLPLTGIDWVIVGGESGPKARPIQNEWVINIKNQCHKARVPFFFKQWGGKNKKKSGRLLEGRTWNEMPTINTTPTHHHTSDPRA